jgi:hypothetical protein
VIGLEGTLPQHAYTIPYEFTDQESRDWLLSQMDNIPLQGYLRSPEQLPAGIVITDGYGQILVWYDASSKLHIIDVTNMDVAKHVNDASYQSPDSSIVLNVVHELQNLASQAASGAMTVIGWLPLILAGGLALYVLPRR